MQRRLVLHGCRRIYCTSFQVCDDVLSRYSWLFLLGRTTGLEWSRNYSFGSGSRDICFSSSYSRYAVAKRLLDGCLDLLKNRAYASRTEFRASDTRFKRDPIINFSREINVLTPAAYFYNFCTLISYGYRYFGLDLVLQLSHVHEQIPPQAIYLNYRFNL